MFFCVAVGLWGGLVIGLVTEYFTSNRFTPVQARRAVLCCALVQLAVCSACSPVQLALVGLVGLGRFNPAGLAAGSRSSST